MRANTNQTGLSNYQEIDDLKDKEKANVRKSSITDNNNNVLVGVSNNAATDYSHG
jgi:hypothetical protein